MVLQTNKTEKGYLDLDDVDRIRYKMVCPRCGYKYYVEIFVIHKWEYCPICGFGAEFKEFVRES